MTNYKNITITISNDEYSASLSINPGDKELLTLIELGQAIKESGVIFGIKREILLSILDRFNKGDRIENELFAEGILPFEGTKADILYKFNVPSGTDSDEAHSAYQFPSFITVQQQQVLAVKIKPKQPIDGTTVTGKHTHFEPIEDIPFAPGKNITKQEEENAIYYKSAIDGSLTYENDILSVSPILFIKEDVDASVGNIQFKGDVHIGRDVLPDFSVESGGKICIEGSADACKLKATESIEVQAGIIGKNKGDATSGDKIYSNFVENSKLIAKNDIIINNGIIGSDVRCGGKFIMLLSRSRIVGSTIRASKGIIAFNVGSQFDTSTHLITGINSIKEKEYNQIRDHLDMKIQEAKNLEARYSRAILERKAPPPAFSSKIKDDIIKWEILKREIQIIYDRMKQFEFEMYDKEAFIRINETLHPRVTLTIGKGTMVTSQEFQGITIRYSLEDEKFIIQ